MAATNNVIGLRKTKSFMEGSSVSAILGASATLAATLLGGGGAIVPLELKVRETGFVVSPILFAGCCAWTMYTSWALLRVSRLSQIDSYEEIARHTIGPIGSFLVKLVIVVNAFFICVSLQGIFVDLVEPGKVDRTLMVLGSGVVMWPITAFVRRVDRLTIPSFLTALTALIFLGFVLRRAVMGPLPEIELSPTPTGGNPVSIMLDSFSTIVIGFVVQFNVLPVYATLPRDGAQTSMMIALFVGMGLTLTVYVSMDLLSYLTIGRASYEDTIEEYTNMGGGAFATCELGIGQLMSYPILAHAAVTEVGKIVKSWRCGPAASAKAPTEKSALIDGAKKPAPSYAKEDPAEPTAAAPATMTTWLDSDFVAEGVAGTLWVVLSTIAAVILKDVGSLLALVGAASATPLMCIFPPLMLIQQEGRGGCAGAFHTFMFVFGCVATLACVIMAVMDYGKD